MRVLCLALVLLMLGSDAAAGIDVKRFYLAKEKATSVEAFVRARERLLQVTPGMPEVAFLEVMGMRVLQKKGEPMDALMDGYLLGASQQWNERRADRSDRFLVLGFEKKGREHPQATVRLRDHLVVEVAWLTDAAEVVLATSSEKRFYRAKQRSTGPSTWPRTAERLSTITVGMPEMAFLDAMHLQVLARRGLPVDAMLEGYLAETSRRLNLGSTDGFDRILAFGWVENGRDIARAMVVLQDGAVSEIRPLTGNLEP